MTDPALPARPPPGAATETLHADRRAGAPNGAIHQPIHTSVQYGYERVDDLIGVFQGRVKGGFNYARQGTPTTAALEAKINRLEGGTGTICFSTGMAALTALFFTLLKAGDHLVASRYVFGNTNSLFGTLGDLGVAVTKVDATHAAAVEAALRPETRIVFVETIANPGTQVPALDAIGALCHERGILFVVDNTITSPALFRPRSVGAGMVVNALTKTIAGHGAALGGSVTDTGVFDWQCYPNIAPAYRAADPAGWGLAQVRKKGLRDMGGSLASEQAHRIALGLETLGLRVARASANALALARVLEAHPAVAEVRYPGLASHPQHAAVARWFSGSGSWLLAFELRDAGRLREVLDRLQVAIKATGLGDTRTLVIPVAPTIFWEAGAAVRAEMGIPDGLVRVSVGIEDEADLVEDFVRALE